MMTSMELKMLNEVEQLKIRMQRAERQLQHDKLVIDSLRATVARLKRLLSLSAEGNNT